MKKGLLPALWFFLALLVILGLAFPRSVYEAFVPGDNRPTDAPCMNDQECASGTCNQEKCT
jgi:hypothetical protein